MMGAEGGWMQAGGGGGWGGVGGWVGDGGAEGGFSLFSNPQGSLKRTQVERATLA